MYGMGIKGSIKKIMYSNLLIQSIFLQSAVNGGINLEHNIAHEQNQPVAVLQTENQPVIQSNPSPESTTPLEQIEQKKAVDVQDASSSHNGPMLALPSIEPTVIPTPPIEQSEQPLTQATVVETPLLSPTDVQEPPLLGIDTVSLEEPQGNWLFKRVWWERAQETYEKVRILVAQIMDYRMEFFMHRSEINRAVLDPFYSQVGFAQGQLKEVIERVLQTLQDEKNSTMILDHSERALSSDVETTKEVLERFKIDVEMVDKLDAMIDKALEQLVAECNKVRSYEQEAWQSYKKIGQELSDSKARELFYYLDVHMRYIKDIQRYLQQDFARYFQDLIRQISSETERLLGVVNKLKERGIDFKKQLSKQSEELNAHMSDQIVPVSDAELDEDSVYEKKGFFNELKLKASSLFQSIKDFFVKSLNAAYRFFGSKKDSTVENEY